MATGNTARNEITGKVIKTNPTSTSYRDGWDLAFGKKEQSSKKMVLVSASWCGPCHGLKKRLEESGLNNKIEIKEADKDSAFFKEHNIKSVPRLLIMEGDAVVEIIQGADDIFKAISSSEE
jgi:predicted thioredoxin/glutaredoxin